MNKHHFFFLLFFLTLKKKVMLTFCDNCDALLVFNERSGKLVCEACPSGEPSTTITTGNGDEPLLLSIHSYPNASSSMTPATTAPTGVPNPLAIVNDKTLLVVHNHSCPNEACPLRDTTIWGTKSPISGVIVAPFASQMCLDKSRGQFICVCHACLHTTINNATYFFFTWTSQTH